MKNNAADSCWSRQYFNKHKMTRRYISLFFPILFLALSPLLPSCVSKKKLLSESARRATCDTTLQQLNNRNMVLNQDMANLQLQLAEKTGEANAFREMQDKQDAHINRLELEIERLTDQSLSQQTVMDDALVVRTQELEEAKAVIQGFKDEVTSQEMKLAELVGQITATLPELSEKEFSFKIQIHAIGKIFVGVNFNLKIGIRVL